MTKISKWMSAVSVLALSTSLAVASAGPGWQGEEGRHGRHHDGARLAEKLNFSEGQKMQFEAMHKEFREQNAPFLTSFHQNRKELREARKAGDSARADALKATLEGQREQMKQLRRGQEEKLVSLMTAQQRAQFDQMKAEREERHRQHEEHRGGR